MPIYKYKARNMSGEQLQDMYESDSLETLKKYLSEKGYFLVEATPQAAQISIGAGRRVTVKDMAIFCRQFAVILGAGIPVLQAVSILRDQTEKVRLKDALDTVCSELQKGRVLSDCMEDFPKLFPTFMRNMVKVGEMSGTLESVLMRLSAFYDRETAIRKKVKGAMTYPVILLVLAVGVVIFLMIGIIPMFTGVLGGMGAEMPAITRILIAISDFTKANLFMILAVILLISGGIYYYVRTPSGARFMDGLAISLPVLRDTTRKMMTSRFARSMGILLRSGIPVVEAIDIMSNLLGNRIIEERFAECRDKVRQGRGLAGPIKEIDIFPPLLIHMVAVGEKTGELDEMLDKTSEFFDSEVEESIDLLTSFIQPVMIIFLAAIICTVILAVMLPMTSIMESIQ